MTGKMPFHFLLISAAFLLCVQRSLCVNSFSSYEDIGPFVSPHVLLPPDILSIHHHHHHHHAPPVARSFIPVPTSLVIQRRALFDEALAFKVGLGLGTVGGAAGGAAAGTGVGAIGATILGKTALKTTKLVFGKYKIPVPVKLPLPIPFPLPLPLPIPILIPKLLSIHKGFDSGYHHHHHRDDERPRDDGYRYDRDRYESIQRDDDHKKDKKTAKRKPVSPDEEAGERMVSTARKPGKKITRTKKRNPRPSTASTTTKKPKSMTTKSKKKKSSPLLQLSKGISITFTRR